MKTDQDANALSDRLIAYLRTEFESPAMDFAAPMTRLQGGFETASYRFELDGVPEGLPRLLVLRLYPQFYGTQNAIWESTVQGLLAGEGFPVARAHVVCTDTSVLGGAFFLMDYLPGRPLAVAPQESVPRLLGETHADLHDIDPARLVKALDEKGIDGYGYGLQSRFDWLDSKAEKWPWLRPALDWLLDHRPPEPERLSVCHGDFHPFNLMFDEGQVTGVLDWPGFAIADPAYDVGNTLVLITITSKHVASSMGAFSSVDWDLMANLYLAAYRSRRPLDDGKLDYYRVRRCAMALVQGVEGQTVWQHPLVVRDLLAYIRDVTGIQIEIPV